MLEVCSRDSTCNKVLFRAAARAGPRRADLGTMGRRRSDIEEDGYVWHKYGAKNVRGRKVGYFKCAHRGCEARKKVWRQANGDEAVERAGTHTHAAGEAVPLEEVGEISTDNADEVPMTVNRVARGGRAGEGWGGADVPPGTSGILGGFGLGLPRELVRAAADVSTARQEARAAKSRPANVPKATRDDLLEQDLRDERTVQLQDLEKKMRQTLKEMIDLKEGNRATFRTCKEALDEAFRRLPESRAEMETMTGAELRTCIETAKETIRRLQETLRRLVESVAEMDDAMTRDGPFGDE